MCARRTILLVYLAEALGLVWILEQPMNSAAEFHPRFRDMRHQFPVEPSIECRNPMVEVLQQS